MTFFYQPGIRDLISFVQLAHKFSFSRVLEELSDSKLYSSIFQSSDSDLLFFWDQFLVKLKLDEIGLK